MKTFDKEKLLKIKEITALDHENHKQFVDPSKLKLILISSQLCWEDEKGFFIPIGRITEIKELFEEEEKPEEIVSNEKD
jgi:hypothetical protein